MIFGGREIVFRVSSVSCAESRSKARMQERELSPQQRRRERTGHVAAKSPSFKDPVQAMMNTTCVGF